MFIVKMVHVIFRKRGLFLITVLVPTVLAILYYGVIAADVYISESRFVVRGFEEMSASPVEQLFKSAGISRAHDDAQVIQDFMMSHDAMLALVEKISLKDVYSRGDIVSRFPGLELDDSLENMRKYYQKMVNVQIIGSSSIVRLQTRAFRSEDAHKINTLLLEMSEDLINRLNERAHKDLIRIASKEVAEAEERAQRAALSIATYRSKKHVVDPERQSFIHIQQIAKLREELVHNKALLSQLSHSAQDNPQVPMLKKRIQVLEEEIQKESAQIVGSNSSLTAKAAEYQLLLLEKDFADKQLVAALAALERAQNEAQRQQLYLERISQPSLPDAPLEPRRIRAIAVVFIMSLVVWGIMSLLIVAVKEHMD